MDKLTLTKIKVKEAEGETSVGLVSRVILFNDDWHSFEEVIHQLMIAIHCPAKIAEEMAWTVHSRGQCEVFNGALEECLEVSTILEEIELKTEIRVGS